MWQMQTVIYTVSIHILPEGRMKDTHEIQNHTSKIVSIHILPEGRMKAVKRTNPATGLKVSIHILPEGRMKVPMIDPRSDFIDPFQSTSFPKEG